MSETAGLLPNTVYHIYNHANGSENLFRSTENYRYFLKKYGEYIPPIADTYAYCLMPNHFHLMIKIKSEAEILEYLALKKPNLNLSPLKLEALKDKDLQGFRNLEGLVKGEDIISNEISQIFSNLFNAYSKAYNKMYDRRGSLFIPRFKRKPVETDEYFSQLIAYIHLNPVKHGFCTNLLDWEHSSIHSYYSEKVSKVNLSYLRNMIGNKESLIAFHDGFDINKLAFEF